MTDRPLPTVAELESRHRHATLRGIGSALFHSTQGDPDAVGIVLVLQLDDEPDAALVMLKLDPDDLDEIVEQRTRALP